MAFVSLALPLQLQRSPPRSLFQRPLEPRYTLWWDLLVRRTPRCHVPVVPPKQAQLLCTELFVSTK
jgi:hypothetical protein